jgi:hypothetical protein
MSDLLERAAHRQVAVRAAAAADAAAPPSLLATLAGDSSRTVRRAVAARPETPGEALATLAADPDRQTRVALALNPGTPADVLIALLADAHWSVRLAVIENPAIDRAVQRAMCESDDQDVRFVLAQRPPLPQEIAEQLMHDPAPEIRKALAETTDLPAVLETLLADPEARVRASAGMNPHTTAEQRATLVHDPSWEVRNSVVWSKAFYGWDISEDDLLLLAGDRSVHVRWHLANLPGSTRRVYETLAADADESVAAEAKRWLLPPDDPEFPPTQRTVLDDLLGDMVEQGHHGGPEYLGRPIPNGLRVDPDELEKRLRRRVTEMNGGIHHEMHF